MLIVLLDLYFKQLLGINIIYRNIYEEEGSKCLGFFENIHG